MAENYELKAARSLARLAISYLEQHEKAPIPINYEIFYVYAAGTNPDLATDLETRLENNGLLSSEDMKKLHQGHLSDQKLARKLEGLGRGLGAMIKEIRNQLRSANQSAGSIESSLKEFDKQFQSNTDPDQFIAQRELLAAAAQQMMVTNQALEANFARSSEQIKELTECLEIVSAESAIDKLTNVANRDHFDRRLDDEILEARETGQPLALLMIDVDHFKKFNDTHGHQVGDAILRFVAKMIRIMVKGRDLAARYGGEEFSVILPDTNLQQGIHVAEKIRTAVAAMEAQHKATGRSIGNITVSIGVAILNSTDTAESFIDRADKCLYKAKENGRNQVKSQESFNVQSISAA